MGRGLKTHPTTRTTNGRLLRRRRISTALKGASFVIPVIVAFTLTMRGSLVLGAAAGLFAFLVATILSGVRGRGASVPDPSRRRFLLAVSAGVGLASVAGGTALGGVFRRLSRADSEPVLTAASSSLGEEYLELITRGYRPGRSGDIQLIVTPYSSSNYEQESLHLLPDDPRSSHAIVWMYGQRVPILVWAPGLIEPQDHVERVTLADLAPSAAKMMSFSSFRPADGSPLPGIPSLDEEQRPRVIVTLVIDGGGWNLLRRWPDAWPGLKRLMREGATYRNAISGSFPAVTASTHATIGTGAFPRTHGITGHNVRWNGAPVKAWGTPGNIDPSFLLAPTLADRWAEETGNRAWVGEIGYQVWHVGMLGRGGRPLDGPPVGVYWDEAGDGGWKPHHPVLYRLPRAIPSPSRLEALVAARTPYAPSPYDVWAQGGKAMCCSPPIARYQGELIECTFDSEPIGEDGITDLVYVNFKAPDYAGHVYNMDDPREAEVLGAVDQEIDSLSSLLMERFGPGGFALIVTADHGQCPLIDENGGVRIDPIQLQADLEREFGASVFGLIQWIAPSEIFLDRWALVDAGYTAADLAAFLTDYRYKDDIGPYVSPQAILRDKLGAKTFAAALPERFITELATTDLTRFGVTSYPDGDVLGLPPRTW